MQAALEAPCSPYQTRTLQSCQAERSYRMCFCESNILPIIGKDILKARTETHQNSLKATLVTHRTNLTEVRLTQFTTKEKLRSVVWRALCSWHFYRVPQSSFWVWATLWACGPS